MELTLTAAIVSMSNTLVQYLHAFAFPYLVWHSSAKQRIVLFVTDQKEFRQQAQRQTPRNWELKVELKPRRSQGCPGRDPRLAALHVLQTHQAVPRKEPLVPHGC